MDPMMAVCMIAGTLLGIVILILMIIFKDPPKND